MYASLSVFIPDIAVFGSSCLKALIGEDTHFQGKLAETLLSASHYLQLPENASLIRRAITYPLIPLLFDKSNFNNIQPLLRMALLHKCPKGAFMQQVFFNAFDSRLSSF